jgi:hypothetical protein
VTAAGKREGRRDRLTVLTVPIVVVPVVQPLVVVAACWPASWVLVLLVAVIVVAACWPVVVAAGRLSACRCGHLSACHCGRLATVVIVAACLSVIVAAGRCLLLWPPVVVVALVVVTWPPVVVMAACCRHSPLVLS